MKKLTILVLSICFFLSACIVEGNGTKASTANQKIEVPFISVIDGDTIKVQYNNKKESVRLLLIDTPETAHPQLGVQPFGPEAKAYAKKFFNTKTVTLEFDVSGDSRDKYGRMLAYAWVGKKMYNEEVLKQGLARVAYIYAPNTKHVDAFYDYQKTAQKKALNIWSIENYATEDGFKADAKVQQPQETTKNDKCTIKGNISSNGDKIYHITTGQYYKVTIAEEMFCTEKEAEAAGYRKSKR